MEPGPSSKREPREITYQVGWKKGKIQLDKGQEPAVTPKSPPPLPPRSFWTVIHTYAWKEAPIFPQAWCYGVLWALPVLSFLLILGLVYKLTHAVDY